MLPSFDHRIVVFGDVMLDRFVYGTARRLSPEAPVPVVRQTRRHSMPGGAGNVTRNIAALGGKPALVSLIGTDPEGNELFELLGKDARLVRSPEWRTMVKERIIAQHQQIVRIDDEQPRDITATERSALLGELGSILDQAKVLVLSDYGKGVLTKSSCAEALGLACSRGILSFVDPKGTDYERYAGADVLTPNASELAEATGMPTATDAEVQAAARALLARVDVGAIVATRSEKGMMLISRDGTVVNAPAIAQEVFDVSGAGDTVIGTLALAVAAGLPLPEAIRLANAAASVVVAKLGTAVCSAAELEVALRGPDGVGGALQPVDAARLVREWQATGLTVGFANGCFDVLHAGHVRMLREARSHCDRLVVALNDDASVSRLKGSSRPINTLDDRASVIGALESVDAVTFFSEDTPLELVLGLRPDRLFKGADYKLEDVVGAAEVASWGGRTVLLNLLPGRSTTSIVERMQRPST